MKHNIKKKYVLLFCLLICLVFLIMMILSINEYNLYVYSVPKETFTQIVTPPNTEAYNLWFNSTLEYFKVSNVNEWQNSIYKLRKEISSCLNDEDYGGIDLIQYSYEDEIFLPVGLKIYVRSADQVEKITKKVFQKYNENIGQIEVEYVLAQYSMKALKHAYSDIINLPFYKNEQDNILSIDIYNNRLNLILHEPIPALNRFLETYPYKQIICAGVEGKIPNDV